MLAVPAGDRVRRQVGRGLHVRADGGGEAAAEIFSKPDLLLSAMCGVTGDGAASGGSAEHGGVEYDPRNRERGAFPQ
jgi:hypothetical protein